MTTLYDQETGETVYRIDTTKIGDYVFAALAVGLVAFASAVTVAVMVVAMWGPAR